MALNIRNEETERLAAELAALTGESKTTAVTIALRERLAQVRRRTDRNPRLLRELNELAVSCAALPVRDRRTADEILGYDDRGLPQ